MQIGYAEPRDDVPDSEGVILGRALYQGLVIGALMGGLTAMAVTLAFEADPDPGTPWFQPVLGCLTVSPLFGAIGSWIGAIVGAFFALVPAAALALGRRYFHRHIRAAAACAGSVGLVAALGSGYLACTGVEFFAIATVPAVLGVVLAAACARYVVTGRGFRIAAMRG